MGDARARSLERSAAVGDPEAGARVIRERMRSGLSLARVKLAAYVGDEACVAAIGWNTDPYPYPVRLDSWTPGLFAFADDLDGLPEREVRRPCTLCDGTGSLCSLCARAPFRKQPWPGREYVALMVGEAVGREVLEEWGQDPVECGCPVDPGCFGHDEDEELVATRRALDAAKLHLVTGTLESREAYTRLDDGTLLPWLPDLRPGFLGVTLAAAARELGRNCEGADCGEFGNHHGECNDTDRIPNEARVKAVVREALVPWLLNEEVSSGG